MEKPEVEIIKAEGAKGEKHKVLMEEIKRRKKGGGCLRKRRRERAYIIERRQSAYCGGWAVI